MGSHKIEYRCSLLHGLHARPATQLEAFCKRFSATIDWCNQRNGRCANAKSVLALLGTDTLYDDRCEITLSGKDASHAASALLPEVPTVAQAILQVQQHFQTQFLTSESGYLQALLLTHAGQTSHTIILARAANIPVLTGLTDSRVQQAAGQTVIADAELGICLLQPDVIAERYYALYAQVKQQRRQQLQQQSLLAGYSADRQWLEIAANITSVTDAQNAFQAGAEGIGLFRTEMLFMERDTPPDEEEQYQVYRVVLLAPVDQT